jgi:hypothetical protein
VALVKTDDSGERITFIITGTRTGEVGGTLAVTKATRRETQIVNLFSTESCIQLLMCQRKPILGGECQATAAMLIKKPTQLKVHGRLHKSPPRIPSDSPLTCNKLKHNNQDIAIKKTY